MEYTIEYMKKLDSLIKNLCNGNKEITFKFLFIYSRFEYSLKRAGFIYSNNEKPKANWEKFIKGVAKEYSLSISEELKEVNDYLLSFPPKVQIVKNGIFCFRNDESANNGSDLLKIYHCIRITRNNLFHGGKYPIAPTEDISRDKKLINNCIVVLCEMLKLNKIVNKYFWDY